MIPLTQTIWSFQSYRQLREADSQAASAEALFLSAQQNLGVRVAQAYEPLSRTRQAHACASSAPRMRICAR